MRGSVRISGFNKRDGCVLKDGDYASWRWLHNQKNDDGDDGDDGDDDDDDDDDEVSITLKECRWELEHKQFEWQGIDREAHTQSDYHHQDGDDYHHEDGDYLLNLVVFFFLVFSF